MNIRKILFPIILLIPFLLNAQCISDCNGDGTRFGEAAGLNNTAPQVSIFGRSAGLNNTGDLSSFFGFNAGRNNTGRFNSFFGHNTGIENTAGFANSFFGYEAGKSNTLGDRNSFFGTNAGLNNSGGGSNSFFGTSAGHRTTTGSANNFLGNDAGYKNTTGSSNNFFGRATGQNNSTGTSNCFFGNSAGFYNSTGSFNIAIGSQAGPSTGNIDTDSTLYIDVMRTDEPLIYGHFDQRLVRINGEFEAMGGTANGSDINLKNEIVPVEEKDILEKLATIQISEWAYKDQSGVRHIGPMAQDFFKAFGLGNSDKTINTIDADGVSLAAIQALYQSFEEEKKNHEILVKALVKRIEILESKLDKIK